MYKQMAFFHREAAKLIGFEQVTDDSHTLADT